MRLPPGKNLFENPVTQTLGNRRELLQRGFFADVAGRVSLPRILRLLRKPPSFVEIAGWGEHFRRTPTSSVTLGFDRQGPFPSNLPRLRSSAVTDTKIQDTPHPNAARKMAVCLWLDGKAGEAAEL